MLRSLLLVVASFAVPAVAAETVLMVTSVPKNLKVTPQVAAEIQKAVGAKPEDASRLYASLQHDILSIDFNRKPPAGWPRVLNASFQEGHAACGARVGKPKPGPEAQRAMLTAQACGEKLSAALWNRYVIHRAPSAVVRVLVQDRGTAFDATVQTVRPADNTRWTASTTGLTRDAVAQWVTSAVADTLAGRGPEQAADLDTELPAQAQGGQVAAVSRAQNDLPAVPVGCSSGVPGKVTITPSSPLAATLAARWARSVEEGGVNAASAATCSLTASQESEQTVMGSVEVLEVVLSCDGKQHRGMTALGMALQGRSAADVISERVLKAAFKSYCGR